LLSDLVSEVLDLSFEPSDRDVADDQLVILEKIPVEKDLLSVELPESMDDNLSKGCGRCQVD
jgi:hypothetical protein